MQFAKKYTNTVIRIAIRIAILITIRIAIRIAILITIRIAIRLKSKLFYVSCSTKYYVTKRVKNLLSNSSQMRILTPRWKYYVTKQDTNWDKKLFSYLKSWYKILFVSFCVLK